MFSLFLFLFLHAALGLCSAQSANVTSGNVTITILSTDSSVQFSSGDDWNTANGTKASSALGASFVVPLPGMYCRHHFLAVLNFSCSQHDIFYPHRTACTSWHDDRRLRGLQL
jgi:hypothetical protein